MMQLLVIVGANVAARKHVFQMLRKIRINGHQIFKAPVLGALFYHQNLAIALDDGGLDLANLFVHQHFVGKMPIKNLLPDFGHALRAQRVSRARPAQRRLRLLIRLQQRLVRPLRRRRRILLDPVQPVKHHPRSSRAQRYCLLDVLNWLVHCPGTFQVPGIELRRWSFVLGRWPTHSLEAMGFCQRRTTNDGSSASLSYWPCRQKTRL